MLEFINNSWFIGITGGIVSSLVVFFITRKFFSRKENREYIQKLQTANNEIIYAIRPFLVERKLPSAEIIDSVVLATAVKYGVNEYDLIYYEELSDNLVKEVTENSFLTSEDKLEFCELANQLKKYAEEEEEEEKEKRPERTEKITSSNNSTIFSLTLALVTLLFTVTSIIGISFKEIKFDTFEFPTLIAISALVPIIALTLSTMLQFLKRMERKFKDSKKEDQRTESDNENAS